MEEKNEQILTDLPKEKRSKSSLVLAILSFVTILLLAGGVAYMFTYYISNFADTDSAANLALALFIPLIICFFVFLGALCICLFILAILLLKGRKSSKGTKILAIFTIIFDYVAVGGLVFLAVIRRPFDIFYALSAIYMLAYAIFTIFVLNVKEK